MRDLESKWPRSTLDELTEAIDYGLTASATTNEVGPKFLRITDIKDGTVDWNSVPYCLCTPEALDKYRLHGGDIVFARTGATTGKSYLIGQCPDNAVFASYLIRLRPKPIVDPLYLSFFFDTPDYWNQISRSSTGTAQAGVNASKLKNIGLPLPPLPEQRRIAAILDKADAIRRKRQEALALTDEFLRSAFVEMFGGSQSEDWPQEKIENLASDKPNAIRTGPFGSQLLHSEFVDEGIAVLGIDNVVQNFFSWTARRFITKEKYEALKRYRVFPDDVLITIMGTCGRCAIVPDDIPESINTKHLCCITLDRKRCLPVYLHACFLNHPKILRQLGISERGAVMPGLNMQIIKNLSVPLPPISLQQQFAAIVHSFERSKRQWRTGECQAKQLFQSLQQRAFSGQL